MKQRKYSLNRIDSPPLNRSYHMRPPIFIRPDDAKMYEQPHSLIHIGLTTSGKPTSNFNFVRVYESFRVYEDVSNRPGYIGNVTGSRMSFLYPALNVSEYVRKEKAKIVFLKSYASMGKFLVNIAVPISCTSIGHTKGRTSVTPRPRLEGQT